MSSNRFSCIKILVMFTGLSFLLVGCSQMNSKPASNTSFAQTPACANNPFLQKYNCDTANIEQAAESGDPDAQYALGYLHYYGVGVAQDEQTALVWIRKAAAQDQPLAKQALLIMEKSSLSTESSVNNASVNPTPGNPTPGYTETSPVSNSNVGISADVNAKNPSLNSQLPAYGQPTQAPSNSQQPAIDMLKTSDASSPDASLQATAPTSGSSANKIDTAQSAHKLTADERYLLSVNPKSFTVQLMGSHNLQSILDFIQANQLSGQVNYYKTALQGKSWYMLILGRFTTKPEAQSALNNLSVTVRAQNPWVRSFADIQHEIKQSS